MASLTGMLDNRPPHLLTTPRVHDGRFFRMSVAGGWLRAPLHIFGAVLGLAGTVLLFTGNSGSGFAPSQVPGLIAAFVAAFVWAAYSVMSRKLKSVPTVAVAGFCLATALLAALVHGLVEITTWPDT